MNILFWVLQGLLAFWNLTGGVFSAINFQKLRSPRAAKLPKGVWLLLGGLQVLAALGLVLPGVFGVYPELTVISAGYLVFNSLLGCLLFSQYAGFPGLLWGVIPAVLAAIVLFGRM